GRHFPDEPPVDVVHAGEVVEVRQEDRCLHDPVDAAARGFENRLQVQEHPLRLRLDRLARELRGAGDKSELTRDEHEPAGRDRLRIRSSLERSRSPFCPHGCFLRHLLSLHAFGSRRRGRQACASATPSALKMASRTCCVSVPSISPTWTVNPAPSARRRRNSATTSVSLPPL